MANAIVKPSLVINGEVIQIVPNSLIVVKGTGERQVKTQSAGGGQLEDVIFEDVATAIGQVKFKVFNTNENLNTMETVVNNGASNTVQYTSSEGQNGTMLNGIVVNDPEINYGVDGETEFNMKGSTIQ